MTTCVTPNNQFTNTPNACFNGYPVGSFPNTPAGHNFPGQNFPGQTFPGQTFPGQNTMNQNLPGQTFNNCGPMTPNFSTPYNTAINQGIPAGYPSFMPFNQGMFNPYFQNSTPFAGVPGTFPVNACNTFPGYAAFSQSQCFQPWTNNFGVSSFNGYPTTTPWNTIPQNFNGYPTTTPWNTIPQNFNGYPTTTPWNTIPQNFNGYPTTTPWNTIPQSFNGYPTTTPWNTIPQNFNGYPTTTPWNTIPSNLNGYPTTTPWNTIPQNFNGFPGATTPWNTAAINPFVSTFQNAWAGTLPFFGASNTIPSFNPGFIPTPWNNVLNTLSTLCQPTNWSPVNTPINPMFNCGTTYPPVTGVPSFNGGVTTPWTPTFPSFFQGTLPNTGNWINPVQSFYGLNPMSCHTPWNTTGSFAQPGMFNTPFFNQQGFCPPVGPFGTHAPIGMPFAGLPYPGFVPTSHFPGYQGGYPQVPGFNPGVNPGFPQGVNTGVNPGFIPGNRPVTENGDAAYTNRGTI